MGADASDAGPERLVASLREFEPFDSDFEPRHWVIQTDVPDWESRVDTLAKTIGGASTPLD
jgi:hypothetical protein